MIKEQIFPKHQNWLFSVVLLFTNSLIVTHCSIQIKKRFYVIIQIVWLQRKYCKHKNASVKLGTGNMHICYVFLVAKNNPPLNNIIHGVFSIHFICGIQQPMAILINRFRRKEYEVFTVSSSLFMHFCYVACGWSITRKFSRTIFCQWNYG